MRAWHLGDSTSQELFTGEFPTPILQSGEVLISVHAAGITPSELQWYPTTHTRAGDKRIRAIPGHEFSGVVSALGTDTGGAAIGQEVYGMNDWFADGATAEFCITKPQWIAPKPKNLTHAQAASVPISALSAWQGLFDRARLQRDQQILIHGGSGAVGVFAIQLASRQGASITTTASARNREFLLDLGAQRVLDYHDEDFEELGRQFDVVFDTVGGPTLERSWNVLKPDGRLVTIAADSGSATDEKIKAAFLLVEPNQQQLMQIGDLLDCNQLRAVVDAEVAFELAGSAYTGKIERRIRRGKIVVVIN